MATNNKKAQSRPGGINQILFIITFFMYDIFHIDHLCGTRGEMADGEEVLFTSNQGKSHANFHR